MTDKIQTKLPIMKATCIACARWKIVAVLTEYGAVCGMCNRRAVLEAEESDERDDF